MSEEQRISRLERVLAMLLNDLSTGRISHAKLTDLKLELSREILTKDSIASQVDKKEA